MPGIIKCVPGQHAGWVYMRNSALPIAIPTDRRGDYRTGKRLNVRKLIPYIASNYRKDKIWLRRTKLARRNNHILLAVDDSRSMADNDTPKLALLSLSLLQSALCRVEAGTLSVCKFGADAQLLAGDNSSGGNWSSDDGAKCVQALTFRQNSTNVAKLLDFSVRHFSDRLSSGDAPAAQLLLIVSDGRGIFAHGAAKMMAALQRTLAAGIFPVYIIVDNPKMGASVLDIKVPIFSATPGAAPAIKSYMEDFPFPFYVLLRQIDALPAVVGDALRQWFEAVHGAK